MACGLFVRAPRAAAIVAVLSTTVTSALSQATFQGLGITPWGTYSVPSAVSADGSVVVGDYRVDPDNGQAFRWTAEGGMQGLGTLGQGTYSWAGGVSADGTVVVGYSDTGAAEQAFRWTPGGGMQALGFLDAGSWASGARGVSGDGSVIVGWSDTGAQNPAGGWESEAFLWTPGGSMDGLGHLGPYNRGSAAAVSANGMVVVGEDLSGPLSAPKAEAFRWTPGGGMQGLGFLPNAYSSRSLDVSADGQVVVGDCYTSSGYQSFRWTASEGMQALGSPPGRNFSGSMGISGDGSVIVGSNITAFVKAEGFIWDDRAGMRPIQNVLARQGANLAGWTLTCASAISADGHTIVGAGMNPAGQYEAWLATLPVTYGIFIGSNDANSAGVIRVNGQADATAVCGKFNALVPLRDPLILKYNVDDAGANPNADVFAALDRLTSQVRPGDNLIFFYAGHGSGSKTDLGVEESLWITRTPGSGQVIDDDLVAWFRDEARRETWAEVNKLFILDSCYSAGFWNGEDDDLRSLDKVALLAAAQEMGVALSNESRNGEGHFSIALEDGLTKGYGGCAWADINNDGLTVEELRDWLIPYPSYAQGIEGYLRDGGSGEIFSATWDVAWYASDDFRMVVPEPGTACLLVLGATIALHRRRRRRVHANP